MNSVGTLKIQYLILYSTFCFADCEITLEKMESRSAFWDYLQNGDFNANFILTVEISQFWESELFKNSFRDNTGLYLLRVIVAKN